MLWTARERLVVAVLIFLLCRGLGALLLFLCPEGTLGGGYSGSVSVGAFGLGEGVDERRPDVAALLQSAYYDVVVRRLAEVRV